MLIFNFYSQTIFPYIVLFYPHSLYFLGEKEKRLFFSFEIKTAYLAKHKSFMRLGQLFGQMLIVKNRPQKATVA